MSFVPTRAGRVFYREQGEGTPVVLLHATLHDSHDFDAIAPKLAKQYRVIAIDWPGHGESDEPTVPPSASSFADVLEEIVEQLDLPPAVFIGNSIGGFAAARLAITHPSKVRALVLVNSGGFIPWTAPTKAFTRMLGNRHVSRLVMPWLVKRYMSPSTDLDTKITAEVAKRARTKTGARTAAAVWRSFTTPSHDLRADAEKVTAPTLLVWGEKDPIIPKKVGLATQKMIKGSQLEFLRTGHVVFASQPEVFLAKVEPFISED